MYNRYIPQPDGSYSRSRMDDPPPMPGHSQPPPCPPEPTGPPLPPPHQGTPPKPPVSGSVSGFLKNLLPPDFDTGDLIVVLLLLLLAGDCEEDRATTLLTMVLYLFL